MRIESRKSLLAKVHIARKDLALDESTYRSMLERLVGMDSAGDCTVAQLTRVVAEFRRLGWNAAPASKATTPTPKPAKGKAPLLGKITAMLAEAKRPDAYAEGMARRMYKRDKLAFCTARELQGIVAALVKDAKRHGRPV